MLSDVVLMIIDALASFFTLLLLARFYMQWMRASFRNQLGFFVMRATDWLVLPLRRVVPAVRGLDLASLLPAVLVQAALVVITLLLKGAPLKAEASLALVILGFGVLEVFKQSLYLLIAVVLMSAILSWVNPYSPIKPLLDVFAQPFLAPLQRRIPTIANVDLSPLVLLLALQVLLTLIAHARAALLPHLL
ncbi:MAG: hypothetical protein RIR70_1816 [Pseudomonadota bacterium]|jgi:YggT family protein